MVDVETLYKFGELAVVVGSAIAVLLRMGKMMGAFETQKEEISTMKATLTKLSDVVTQVAVQKVEMAHTQEQVNTLFRWYDELRRGQGYIGDQKRGT